MLEKGRIRRLVVGIAVNQVRDREADIREMVKRYRWIHLRSILDIELKGLETPDE